MENMGSLLKMRPVDQNIINLYTIHTAISIEVVPEQSRKVSEY